MKRIESILDLLSLTMVTPNMLTQGGIVYSPNNITESNKRKARKLLQQLYKRKLANFKEVSCVGANKPQKFYFITKEGLNHLGKRGARYHEIKEGTVQHDTLTALYLTHLYRNSQQWSTQIEWYPPFPLDGKICDGAVILMRNEKLIQSIIIETDRATHAHRIMREKFNSYISFLPHNNNLSILFIVSSSERSLNLQSTLRAFLEQQNMEEYKERISFVCPQEMSPDQAIFELPVSST